jgi:hypothetical protein
VRYGCIHITKCSEESIRNIYLTNSGQNAAFWIFCDYDKGIG